VQVTNLEFILQVTIRLILLLNLVNFMKFSDSLVNFMEFSDSFSELSESQY
jgi:hypothetical protein